MTEGIGSSAHSSDWLAATDNDLRIIQEINIVKLGDLVVLSAAIVALFLAAGAARGMELDYLQTDPRFTGGEFNANDPNHPNFWFYDQYAQARTAIQAAGVNLIAVGSITMPSLVADSDALYMPPPTNPSARTYPLTNQEISVIQQYVATGRSVIFNLGNGTSAAMDNDLLSRLGLSGTQSPSTVAGNTTYPLPNQPAISGAYGSIEAFDYTGTGVFSSLGSMRSLVQVNGSTVIPYVEKGDVSKSAGAYFFILDDSYLMNWSSESASQQNLFMNMVLYATQPQYEHYVVTSVATTTTTATTPEPRAALLMFVPMAVLLARVNRRSGRRLSCVRPRSA